MSGIIFSNVNSGNTQLYISTASGNRWLAILLPGNTYTETTIDLPTVLQYATQQQQPEVYFLFAINGPAAPGIGNFISQYQPYLVAYRQQYIPNITFAWLSAPASAPSPANTTVMNFAQPGSSFALSQTFNATIGSSFGMLGVVSNTNMAFTPSDAPDTLELAINTNNPNLTFASTVVGSQSVITSNISIPFSGSGMGSLRFALNMNLAADFRAYRLAQNFYYGSGVNIPTLTYPILQPGSNSSDFALTQTEIDLLDINNATGLNTYFALTGQIFTTNTGATRPASFPSFFSIDTGYPLTLWPSVNLTDSGRSLNNLYPTEFTARFVLSPADAAGNNPNYLVPEGDFYLDPGMSAASFADKNGQFSFLAGLSGTEVIKFTPYSNTSGTPAGDVIRFKSNQPAYAPNFPAKAVSLIDPGTQKPALDPSYLTAWAQVVGKTSAQVRYASQPQGASLYAESSKVRKSTTAAGFLGFFEPSVQLPQTQDFYVPLVPYLGISTAYQPEETSMKAFESKVLSAKRKALITDSKPTAAGGDSGIATTPQGLVADVGSNGQWNLLNLAQNTVNNGAPEYLQPKTSSQQQTQPQYQLSFINLQPELQNSFMTNQQFMVVTNSQYLGKLFSKMKNPDNPTADPVFNNKMFIRDWPFDLNVGTSNTYSDYNNVVIFKFCQGSLIDRVKNPTDWTQPGLFNIDKTSTDPAADYNKLISISAWLQNYFQTAEDAYANALADPSSDQARFYEKFHRVINDSNWNGILALKVDIDLQEFPQQLKGLITGINLRNFNAHHFGIEVNRVHSGGGISMQPISSLFGLINYVDPAYNMQLLQHLDPNRPVPPAVGAVYDFKVLYLQVLFENTAIKDFASKVQLTMNRLFSDSVTGTNNQVGAANLNTIVLNGSYQDHNGTSVYVFDNKDDNLFYFDSNLLKNVEISKIQFNTLTTDPLATDIQSRFMMWGYLNFSSMSTVVPPAKEGAPSTTCTLDAFSFGQGDGAQMQRGLNYSNLYIDMRFNLATPSLVTYGFDAGQIAFNSSASSARAYSLYPNFALQITNLVSGNDSTPPSGLGYLTLSLPNMDTSGLSGDWYGLQMTLNLGTPGELASSAGFNASMLLAWSPGASATDTSYNAMVGIRLPGTSGNAKLLSLQGLLKLTIDQLRLQFVPGTANDGSGSYLLTLSNIALKFLGILKLPPGGSTNFLLFGNPNPGATAKSLGWYAAYNKS